MAIKEEIKQVKSEVKRQTISYLTAAFGLVAGLAWNEAIKELIAYLFPSASDTLAAKFIYAVLLSIFTAVFVYYIQKLAVSGAKEEEKKK